MPEIKNEHEKTVSEYTERFRSIRKACGLQQGDIADAQGMERSTYSYQEIGKTMPNIEQLCKMARIYRVSVNDLLGLAGTAVSECPELILTPEQIALRFNNMTKQERQLVLRFRVLCEENQKALLEYLIAPQKEFPTLSEEEKEALVQMLKEEQEQERWQRCDESEWLQAAIKEKKKKAEPAPRRIRKKTQTVIEYFDDEGEPETEEESEPKAEETPTEEK